MFNNGINMMKKYGEESGFQAIRVFEEKLGFTYYYKKDYANAVLYFSKARDGYNEVQKFRDAISMRSYYGLSQLLNGNIENSKEDIVLAESWIKYNSLEPGHDKEYDAYRHYWPLYLYNPELNQIEKANEYLKLAYEIIDKEKIEQYHQHPEKDTHPSFFYMRDIVKAYESLDS